MLNIKSKIGKSNCDIKENEEFVNENSQDLIDNKVLLDSKNEKENSNEVNENIGQRIKELRISKGLSQEKLASIFSVSRQAVQKRETNINEPDIRTLRKIAKFFNVSLIYIIDGKEENNKSVSLENTEPKKDLITTKSFKNSELTVKNIILIIVFTLSVILFFGLLIYAFLNPLYRYQRFSFFWWYVPIDGFNPSYFLFQFLNLASIVGVVLSLVFLFKKKKGAKKK